MEAVCEHKGKGAQSGYGLCRLCYEEFCGGLEGASDPPAFQRPEIERLANASTEMATEPNFHLEPQHENCSNENEEHLVAEADQNASQNEKAHLSEPIPASAVSGNPDTIDDAIGSFKDRPAIEDEIDNFSDIDDVEVNSYLNNEEESRFKKIIWEEMNKEYLQKQAAKEAAAAAARKIYSEASDDVRSAQELAAVAKSREKRRQKRAEEANKACPPQTAAEATRQMLTKKRLSSKINYDVLDKLFGDSPAPTTKKNRADDDHSSNTTGNQLGKQEKEVDIGNLEEQDGEDEDMEGKNTYGEDKNQWLYGNEQEMYDYDYNDQDGYDEY